MAATVELNMRLDVRGQHLDLETAHAREKMAVEFLGRYGTVEHRCKQVWSKPTVYRLTVKVRTKSIPARDLFQLSVLLKQDCISVYYPTKGVGKLVGPKAKEWGKFELEKFDRIDFPLAPPVNLTVHKVYVPDADAAVEERKLEALRLRIQQVFSPQMIASFAPQQYRLTNSAVGRVLDAEGPDALTTERLEGIYELVTEHLWHPAITQALNDSKNAINANTENSA